jgi:threonine/homoserine/homoserine lactone efflux protein
MTDPLQFLLGALILLAAPGPTNTILALAGAGSSRSPAGLLAAELAGYAVAIGLSGLVLLPIIASWPPAETIIKLAVAAYLILAAVRLWRTPFDLATRGAVVGARDVFLATLLNPKGLIVAVAVLPLSDPSLPLHAALFALLVVATGASWFWLGRRVASLSRERSVYIPRAGALALLGFAALVATAAAR